MNHQRSHTRKSGYENIQRHIRTLDLPKIELWENMYADKDYWVELSIPEFTCICPKTGLPDFATLHLKYRPDKACVELKSFKYYINSFRNVGIFHEHAVNRILDDFVRACAPRQAVIRGEFNARGGIQTAVAAEYTRP
ncbi:MAG: preQ(1) synthase [Candidatus Omnitrophica bacterium]|nr:preQ(1) synthase [Candidatus Omnitrophota bacterium]